MLSLYVISHLETTEHRSKKMMLADETAGHPLVATIISGIELQAQPGIHQPYWNPDEPE